MKKLKLTIIGLGATGLLTLGALGLKGDMNFGADVKPYSEIDWVRPTKDSDWAEDVKKESLNFRTDEVLQEMLTAHQAKLERMAIELEKTNYPDAIRWELMSGGMEEPELTKQVNEKIANIKWDYQKLQQSIERMQKEISLRQGEKIDRTSDLNYMKNSPYQK
jgi:hypothetical protein